MNHFVFCHGFGFDYHFWDRIAPYFSNETCSFIDLGYFKNPVDIPYLHNQKIIGIGHSIGLSKLISMYDNFDYMIGLNSFINFLSSDQIIRQKRQKELKALRSSFLKDPDSTLKNFYSRCGALELTQCNDLVSLDIDLIVSDLEWLQNEYTLPEIPTLIISSDNDVVLPQAITSDNFPKKPWVHRDSIMNAGHSLGFKQPREVYDKIMGFLYDQSV